MIKQFYNLFICFLLVLTGTVSYADESYTNEEAKFDVSFPTEYDLERERGDDMTVISLSCTYKNMILLLSAFIYDEVIPEDEYGLRVAEGIIITADAFNSKFKEKSCVRWEVSGGHPGLKNPIKGKVTDGKGGKFNFFGNIYIAMAYGIEYRLTALSTTKKGFDQGIESKFIRSFQIH